MGFRVAPLAARRFAKRSEDLSLEALGRVPLDSRRHHAVQILRAAIVSGPLRPGDKLVERDISERMGISRGPVREALRQLEQEGLVVSLPYRGTEVLGVSREEIEEILVPIRIILEGSAFRHALPRLTGQDFEELEALVGSMEEAAESGDLERIVEADVRFHELVVARSGQLHCAQIWRTIIPRVRAYFYRDGTRHESLSTIVDQHRELLGVLKGGDPGRVLAAVERHIRQRPDLNG